MATQASRMRPTQQLGSLLATVLSLDGSAYKHHAALAAFARLRARCRVHPPLLPL